MLSSPEQTQPAKLVSDKVWGRLYHPEWVPRHFRLGNDEYPVKIGAYRNRCLYVSPRLQEDPQATLDFATEAADFMQQWTGSYSQIVHRQYKLMKNGPLPGKNVRAIVPIPVDTVSDFDRLHHILALLGAQDMPNDEWLAVFILNGDHENSVVAKTVANAAANVIKEAQHDYNAPFAITDLGHIAGGSPIGGIRSLGLAPVIKHLYEAGVENDVIGISNDVDAINMPTNYVRRYCENVEQHPEKDLFTNQLRWEQIGPYGSDANKVLLYWQFAQSALRHRANIALIPDANTAFRLSTYCATGGFKPDYTGEMYKMATFMAVARNGGVIPDEGLWELVSSKVHYDPHSYLRTDSRRVAKAISKNISPNRTWNEVRFSTGNDPVRNEPRANTENIDVLSMCDDIDQSLFRSDDPERTARTQRLARLSLGIPLEQ